MSIYKRGLTLFGVGFWLFVSLSLSNCHILDATVTFVQQLSQCNGSLTQCPQVELSLISQSTPGHAVSLVLIIGTPQTTVMDSGNYAWNLPNLPAGICTNVVTGTVTIAPGTSNRTLGCGGLF